MYVVYVPAFAVNFLSHFCDREKRGIPVFATNLAIVIIIFCPSLCVPHTAKDLRVFCIFFFLYHVMALLVMFSELLLLARLRGCFVWGEILSSFFILCLGYTATEFCCTSLSSVSFVIVYSCLCLVGINIACHACLNLVIFLDCLSAFFVR